MSPLKALQAISTDSFKMETLKFGDIYPNFRLLELIYFQSIIDRNDYYHTCTLISIETSNNQRDIDNMAFYVYKNFMSYFNDIMEKKNGKGGGTENPADNMQATAQQTFGKTMSQAKSMLPKSGKL